MFFARWIVGFTVVLAVVRAQNVPLSPASQFEVAVGDAVAQGGAAAGLSMYERWATATGQENARALRLVARVLLRDSSVTATGAIKVAILQALASDGDNDAAAALGSAALLNEAGPALVAAGNEQAIAQLMTQLESPMSGERKRAIDGLAASKSPRAASLLINLLSDPSPDVRAAAAKGLGTLGARQAIGPLKTLLDDRMPTVKYEAAAALFALDDRSALPYFQELARHPEPGVRLAAAQAMRTQPDAAWLAMVRELATNSDAEIRRQAAELLTPHDAPAARNAIAPLLTSPNVMDRGPALKALLQAETDLLALRRYLRDASAETRIDAALRIFDLTR